MMLEKMITETEVTKNLYADSITPAKRNSFTSLKDAYGSKIASNYITDAKLHDANFAFYTTTLAKLDTMLREPLYFITYAEDVPVNTGGGFVDLVTRYSVDWAGIMNEFRNVVGNNANYIPRINAGLNQISVPVYTWEVAYDLRFVELEKAKNLALPKSIEEIYKNGIVAGWDLFCQKVAYTGINGANGLFNSADVTPTTIDNSSTTGKGFEGIDDDAVVAFFNGIFQTYLVNSNMNISVLPDTILVPSFVGTDLTSRMSALYTNTLRKFIVEHNLAVDESDGKVKVSIKSRPDLDTLGTGNHGRIVAYKKDELFVRMDMPYPIQHFITLPNIDKMSYTSAFVGQVSAVQLPYNTKDVEFGPVTYWDFTTTYSD